MARPLNSSREYSGPFRLEGGTNLRVIQELFGHQSARTTQLYTHVTQSTLETVRSPLDNLE